MFLILFFALSVYGCFDFTGRVVAKDFSLQLGTQVKIEWTTDASKAGCSFVTSSTPVVIELWDDDYLSSDDLLATLTSSKGGNSIPNNGSFVYDVPYDSTSLVEDGASSVFGNLFSLKLYFKLYVASNVALSKSTQTFALNEAGAFIAVRGIQGSAFATGSTIAFQIVAAKLPSREITCQLRERSILPYLFTPLSVAVYTNSSTTLQYIDTYFIPDSTVDSGEYYIKCDTSDHMMPSATFSLPMIGDLTLTKLDLDLKLLSPNQTSIVTANALFNVQWEYTKGLSPNDLLRVDLWQPSRVPIFSATLIASSGNFESPTVVEKSYQLAVPASVYGDSFYLTLTVIENEKITLRSKSFKILPPVKGCTLTRPSPIDVLIAGQSATFEYSCAGYGAGVDVTLSLVSGAAFAPTKLAAAEHLLMSGRQSSGIATFEATVPNTLVQQGWSWRVRFAAAGESSYSYSHYFLLRAEDEKRASQCKIISDYVKCDALASYSYIAVTPQYQLGLQQITLTPQQQQCGELGVTFTLDSLLTLKGRSAPLSLRRTLAMSDKQRESTTKLTDDDNTQLLVSDVSLPPSRNTIIFTLGLMYSVDAAVLRLSPITLPLMALSTNCSTLRSNQTLSNNNNNNNGNESTTNPIAVSTTSSGSTHFESHLLTLLLCFSLLWIM